jgi:preprotein translocase SecE subunit
MAMRRMRGGPAPAGGAPEGARVVQPSVNRASAARMREAMTPSARPTQVRLVPERMGMDFLRESWSELRKVHWPTPEQARNLTGLVIAVSIFVGLVLGAVDFILAKIFQFILGS